MCDVLEIPSPSSVMVPIRNSTVLKVANGRYVQPKEK